MEIITIALAIIALISEILPLVGHSERYNGILHAVHQFMMHMHADSTCNVDVEVAASTTPKI